jgi:hypothetical protein
MATPATEPQASVLAAVPATTSARRWWTLAGLSLASFLLSLSDTALAVARAGGVGGGSRSASR